MQACTHRGRCNEGRAATQACYECRIVSFESKLSIEGSDEHYRAVLRTICLRFQHDERYKDDARFLKIWLQYVHSSLQNIKCLLTLLVWCYVFNGSALVGIQA